jgi:hypothetical protein
VAFGPSLNITVVAGVPSYTLFTPVAVTSNARGVIFAVVVNPIFGLMI